jgi:hypothetical protein
MKPGQNAKLRHFPSVEDIPVAFSSNEQNMQTMGGCQAIFWILAKFFPAKRRKKSQTPIVG